MYTILEEIFIGVVGNPLRVKLNQVSANDLAIVNSLEYSSCLPKLKTYLGLKYIIIHFKTCIRDLLSGKVQEYRTYETK